MRFPTLPPPFTQAVSRVFRRTLGRSTSPVAATAAATVIALMVVLGLVAAAVVGDSPDAVAVSVEATTSTTGATTTSSSTTSTSPPTTTTVVPAPSTELTTGANGEAVRALEQALADRHFDPGKVDGLYDGSTVHAVMAFQKTHGLERTGRASAEVQQRVQTAGDPEAMLPAGGANRVEVDLKRQILMLYKDGSLYRILSVSTGNNKRYCVEGSCATAVTPGGSFKISRRIKGLRVSRLGKLYNPLYFNGGIAIHGAPSVPGYPASHGCVRIPMHTSAWFYDTVPNGTPVYVLGGKRAPVPFDEQAPAEAMTTTTTTVAPTTTTTTTPTPPPTTTTAPVASQPAPPSTTTTTTPATTTTTQPGPPRP